MKKSDRIEAFVENLITAPEMTPGSALDRRYRAYFQCFNEQLYYEAHDVLEHLWLQDRAKGSADTLFFKGLIQVAGAFVHLKKQFLRPSHPTDGKRLRPASRLFRLAIGNLASYGPRHLCLDVEVLTRFCEDQARAIAGANYAVNPWSPGAAPVLKLDC